MSDQLPQLQAILASMLENLSAITDSFNLCFDTNFHLKPGEPVSWAEHHSSANLTGKPGLCVIFKRADVGGYLITIPQSIPLPDWYLEPDESQQSRLQTLGMEWAYGMLPEEIQDSDYSTLVSNDLYSAASWSGINEQTEMLEIQLLNEQEELASESSLWVIGPVESPPLGNEEDDIEDESELESSSVESGNNQAREYFSSDSNEDVSDIIHRIRRLMPMTVNVSVRLAEKKIELEQVRNLSPGTLITFPKSCDDLLDMYVNNKLYAQGEAVKIGEKFGLKVNEVGTVKERPPGIFTL